MQWLKEELGVVKRKSDSKIEGWWTYIEGCISSVSYTHLTLPTILRV